MYLRNKQSFMLAILLLLTSCLSGQSEKQEPESKEARVIVGAEKSDLYLPLLRDKKVGLLVNHTSVINNTHLLDTLLSSNVDVKKIFTPEHGFRGKADAGEQIDDSKDVKSGLPIISLYGSNKKPSEESLQDIDVVIFDSQDVGARFYTYFSTMQYMMEACAAANIEFIIFDRPNPNGHYVDGPVLDLKYQSFVGLNPVPIVFGMTAGEYAQMIVGENWIENAEDLSLKVIPLSGWDHSSKYSLPIKPSPNLPNDQSIALYPSLCLFEGTKVSVGRGTEIPFQIIGMPDSTFGEFTFTPQSIDGMSKYPPYENEVCYGKDLRKTMAPSRIDLSHLIEFYNKSEDKEEFFNKYFVKLAGTEDLMEQIKMGMSEEKIVESWQSQLDAFKLKRKKYLLYEDFE